MKKHTGKIWRGLATTTAHFSQSHWAEAQLQMQEWISLMRHLEPQATKSSREILTLMAFIMNLNLTM